MFDFELKSSSQRAEELASLKAQARIDFIGKLIERMIKSNFIML